MQRCAKGKGSTGFSPHEVFETRGLCSQLYENGLKPTAVRVLFSDVCALVCADSWFCRRKMSGQRWSSEEWRKLQTSLYTVTGSTRIKLSAMTPEQWDQVRGPPLCQFYNTFTAQAASIQRRVASVAEVTLHSDWKHMHLDPSRHA